jgi:hypothetical protein
MYTIDRGLVVRLVVAHLVYSGYSIRPIYQLRKIAWRRRQNANL